MKNITSSVLLIVLILSFVTSTKGYTVGDFNLTAQIKGLKNGSRILILRKRSAITDTISLAIAKNECFSFKNVQLPINAESYYIRIQTEFVEDLQLFLGQTEDVKLSGALKNWPNVTVMDSKLHNQYLKAKQIIKSVWDKEFIARYPDGMAHPDSGMAYSLKTRLAVLKEMPDSYYLPAMIAQWKHPGSDDGYSVVSLADKKIFYDQFSDIQKNSYYGKLLEKEINNGANNKAWMERLEQSVADLESISQTEVGEIMSQTAVQKADVRIFPTGVNVLSKEDLEEKLKNATVILNMAYQIKDKKGNTKIRSNPTSAYVIDENGICITNYHVFKEYTEKPYSSISAMTASGKTYPVSKVLSYSESDDLVVFQVDVKGDKLSALPLGNNAVNGTQIHVMGHPLGNFYQLTSGVVKAVKQDQLAGKNCTVMSITADFNIGSSGGPITDNYGNVVGTVSRIDGSGTKLGVPVSELKKLIEFKK